MFPNLFILNSNGEVLIEKHWERKIQRKVIDVFLEHLIKKTRPRDVLPVIETPKFHLVHSRRGEVIFLTVIKKEVKPDFEAGPRLEC
jgi:AP-3 complex subunit mu